jgi:hypothetical protein
VGSYYYFVSQLPYLVYGQQPPLSSAAFREQCLNFLDPADKAQLDRCSFDIPPELPSPLKPMPGEAAELSSAFIKNWREWERVLRLNLVRFRSQRLKREGAAEAPEYPADAAQAAKSASSMDSPLEAEITLDRARWDAIERFRAGNDFGPDYVFAYLLKLILMERRSSFKPEEGFMEYKTLYASIMENAGSAESGVPK